MLCKNFTIPTNLRVPELTGYAQILAAASESVGLGGLAGLPVTEVGLAVECVFPSGLRDEPAMTVEGILPCDELSSLPFILSLDTIITNLRTASLSQRTHQKGGTL